MAIGTLLQTNTSHTTMQRLLTSTIVTLCLTTMGAREVYNFNPDWLISTTDHPIATSADYDDSAWQRVTLPRAFNEDEAFRVAIDELTDTVCWYRKHFTLPVLPKDGRVFAEFEGVRHGADFYINGHRLGIHENGVMAVGFDLTPYLHEGENVMAVRTDNSWDYRERSTDTPYQWNNRNFNANYGGIPKNVRLHITGPVYQTLPLYSNLGTTGTYIYATDFDIPGHRATVHAESEVINTTSKPVTLGYDVTLTAPDGRRHARFFSAPVTVAPGDTVTLRAATPVDSLQFWSWGYGYLYDVDTRLTDPATGATVDSVRTRTGFRKTEFGDGLIRLNDRVIQMHGYAQRTSNEWPAVGMSVPAWLSDYSNSLMVESGANLVRWMHVAPWKQDVESCDRVGLPQAMPAGDAEKDCDGRQWQQRVELMRDAIIYNRNNPSILFYESGNFRVSPSHMLEMKALRDRFDPHGGRAAGSREMLDVDDAEYGGEMLYINRSAKHPMWAMEYCRDEGLRKYWDAYSYPFHPEGSGPLYRGADASEYNHNQDQLAIEMVRRWYDYRVERPGSGRRCSSGGVKIIFSDTNTHFRGAENYRRSGVTDPMRIPKDAFYAHRVMWGDTWVETGRSDLHIIGHWNYPDSTVKPVYVVSTADSVSLTLNGEQLGNAKRSFDHLFTLPSVTYRPGTLVATGYDAAGIAVTADTLVTAGPPASLRLSATTGPEGFMADGADMVLLEFEVVDSAGHRCPIDNRPVTFTLRGPAEWRGGIAQGPDNHILDTTLPVECGINRALLRSTGQPGTVIVTASAEGLPAVSLSLSAIPVEVDGGLSTRHPSQGLRGHIDKGPTPTGPSYTPRLRNVAVKSIEAASVQDDATLSTDDNEKTAWTSDGTAAHASITYILERPAVVTDIPVKLTGWRKRSYPLEVLAGDTIVWRGYTPKSLGYVHIRPESPVEADRITIRQIGPVTEKDSFNITELAGGPANEMDTRPSKKQQLSIVEIEFLEPITE